MRYSICNGDVLDRLRQMDDCSFDGCLCDPPYGLTQGKKGGSGEASVNLESPGGRSRVTTGFMGMKWDGSVPSVEVWRELLRVLKPGAHLLAFGGTRTHHRLMVAIEDAGFEVRDCIAWMYGSGFPKSHNIAVSIDKAARGVPHGGADPTSANHGKFKGGCSEDNANGRGFGAGPGRFMAEAGEKQERGLTAEAQQWDGYGTALKPAYEPIVVAMKPLDGTYAQNALKHGVAGINVDAGRVESGERPWREARRNKESDESRNSYGKGLAVSKAIEDTSLGRWPANVILDEFSAAELDQQTGTLESGANPARRNSPKFQNTYQPYAGENCTPLRGADSGGASRFFYCAKASPSERKGNTHPTVKPVDLARYLASLILPPKRESTRRLIVPYSGSGSEMLGAIIAGWDDVTGIEGESQYIAIAESRLSEHCPLLA